MTINGGNKHNVKVMLRFKILHSFSRHAHLVDLFLLTRVYFQPQGAGVCPQTLPRNGSVTGGCLINTWLNYSEIRKLSANCGIHRDYAETWNFQDSEVLQRFW